MTVRRRFTILGCGSSPGVPRITGDWGLCNPDNPRNRRMRSALLVEQIAQDGSQTNIVIDTGPDFRAQMLQSGVRQLDAAIYTHAHADHIHGIDDLRSFVLNRKSRMKVFSNELTLLRLREAFSYCFQTPAGSSYPPILEPFQIEEGVLFSIEGPAGSIEIRPILQHHGETISLGFRIGDVAYCTDLSDFPETSLSYLEDLDILIIDALQDRPHPSHLSLQQSLAWIDRIAPSRAILTDMHNELDYDAVQKRTPAHVEPAFDSLTFDCRP